MNKKELFNKLADALSVLDSMSDRSEISSAPLGISKVDRTDGNTDVAVTSEFGEVRFVLPGRFSCADHVMIEISNLMAFASLDWPSFAFMWFEEGLGTCLEEAKARWELAIEVSDKVCVVAKVPKIVQITDAGPDQTTFDA